jgi:transposase
MCSRPGTPWRDLPERFGNWKSAYNRFANWTRAGHWERIFKSLQMRVDRTGSLVDATIARAHQDAAGGKGGSSAISWVVHVVDSPPRSTRSLTAKGRPLHLELTPGQQHEADGRGGSDRARHRQGPDPATRATTLRRFERKAKAAQGMLVVIPSHPTRSVIHRYDKKLYGIRYRIEVFFHRLKRCRRIATRYEKTAQNYLGLLHLACALLWVS